MISSGWKCKIKFERGVSGNSLRIAYWLHPFPTLLDNCYSFKTQFKDYRSICPHFPIFLPTKS
jgi:hypothetical protein